MIKRTLVLFSLIAIACAGCSDSGSGGKFGGRSWNQNLSERDQSLERSIIADVMGGVMADTILPAELSLSGVPPLDDDVVADDTSADASKLSVSVPLERSLTPIADSYEYASASGEGTLTITINGDFEELDVHNDGKRAIRFFPIVVTFAFNSFDYVNSCGLPAIITGNVSCKLQGEVNRASEIMDASGSCATGTNTMTGTVLYDLGNEETHDLFVQTSVRVDGPWYELTSYQFNGAYMLDRRTGTVDVVIARAPGSCVD